MSVHPDPLNRVDERVMDETAPNLFPYHKLIACFSTSPIPTLWIEYGSTKTLDGTDRIFGLFDRHLERGKGER